jgi:hypothetical protein
LNPNEYSCDFLVNPAVLFPLCIDLKSARLRHVQNAAIDGRGQCGNVQKPFLALIRFLSRKKGNSQRKPYV